MKITSHLCLAPAGRCSTSLLTLCGERGLSFSHHCFPGVSDRDCHVTTQKNCMHSGSNGILRGVGEGEGKGETKRDRDGEGDRQRKEGQGERVRCHGDL